MFAPDAGGYAGVALRFIDIVESGKAGSMILCAPNQGAIPGLRDNDIVEITCDIAPDSCTPHKVTDGDERALELIRRVKPMSGWHLRLSEKKAGRPPLTA